MSCVQELPHLVEVVRENSSEQVQLLTVNFDLMIAGAEEQPTLDQVRDFQNSRDLPYPTFVFNEDDYEVLNQTLNLPGPIPVTLAFDANGREVARCESATDAAGFRDLVQAAISGAPSKKFPPRSSDTGAEPQ